MTISSKKTIIQGSEVANKPVKKNGLRHLRNPIKMIISLTQSPLQDLAIHSILQTFGLCTRKQDLPELLQQS